MSFLSTIHFDCRATQRYHVEVLAMGLINRVNISDINGIATGRVVEVRVSNYAA